MFPTSAMFFQKAEETVVSWKKVEVYGIYRIDETQEVKNGKYGDALIVKMTKNNDTRISAWAPKRLIPALMGKTLPCYIMPLGMKKCKNDEKREYQTFELLSLEELKESMQVKVKSDELLSTEEELTIKKYF